MHLIPQSAAPRASGCGSAPTAVVRRAARAEADGLREGVKCCAMVAGAQVQQAGIISAARKYAG